MTKQDIDLQHSAEILSALMDPLQTNLGEWSAKDLRAILTHQLSVALLTELESFVELTSHTANEVRAAMAGNEAATFEAVLTGPAGDRRLVEVIKDYAKAAMASEAALPSEVARVLYVLCLVAAQRRGFADISTLDPATTERERLRCLTIGWLPERARELLRVSA